MSQEETEHTTHTQTVDEKQAENRELYHELTNKNSDYIFKLNKILKENDMPDDERVDQINQMMKTMVAEQSKGVTARQLYGTVNDQAKYILSGPELTEEVERESERSEDWKLYIDGALLIGGIFSITTGISYLFTDTPELIGTGFITLIMNFLLGGLVMLAITKAAPVPGQKGGFLRYFITSLVSIVLWFTAMALIEGLIPPSINFIVPGSIVLIVGVAALALKWYLKRKLNIKGGVL